MEPESGAKTEDPSSAVVAVHHLSYAYGDVFALNDISIDIHAGEFVAIVGENGSGKTTLVKHFNRLLSPASGDVTIRGKNTKDFNDC